MPKTALCVVYDILYERPYSHEEYMTAQACNLMEINGYKRNNTSTFNHVLEPVYSIMHTLGSTVRKYIEYALKTGNVRNFDTFRINVLEKCEKIKKLYENYIYDYGLDTVVDNIIRTHLDNYECLFYTYKNSNKRRAFEFLKCMHRKGYPLHLDVMKIIYETILYAYK